MIPAASFRGMSLLRAVRAGRVSTPYYRCRRVRWGRPVRARPPAFMPLIAGFEQPTAAHFGERAEASRPTPQRQHRLCGLRGAVPASRRSTNVAYGLMVKGIGKVARQGCGRKRWLWCVCSLRRAPAGQRFLWRLQPASRSPARQLVNQPKVLLLDEPLARSTSLRDMQEELKTLQTVARHHLRLRHHDQAKASMADRVAVFNEGRIACGRRAAGHLPEAGDPLRRRFSSAPPTCCRRISSSAGPPEALGSLRPEAIHNHGAAKGSVRKPRRPLATNYLCATFTRLVLDADGLRPHATVPAGSTLPTEGESRYAPSTVKARTDGGGADISSAIHPHLALPPRGGRQFPFPLGGGDNFSPADPHVSVTAAITFHPSLSAPGSHPALLRQHGALLT